MQIFQLKMAKNRPNITESRKMNFFNFRIFLTHLPEVFLIQFKKRLQREREREKKSAIKIKLILKFPVFLKKQYKTEIIPGVNSISWCFKEVSKSATNPVVAVSIIFFTDFSQHEIVKSTNLTASDRYIETRSHALT